MNLRGSRQPVARGLVGPLLGRVLLSVAVVATVACGHMGNQRGARPALVPELYESARYPLETIDSLAVWDAGGWLLCTAKSTDRILVFDTRSGTRLREFGRRGSGSGEFRLPNGISVVGDLLLVVERDNHRVQVVRLPDLETLGMVGAEVLRRPYGLAAFFGEGGVVELYVTDSYMDPGPSVPPPAELGERVKHFRLKITDDGVENELVRSFGATNGSGVLRTVESIAADPAHDRLLVADEDPSARDIKVYTLDGRFTGRVIGRGLHAHEPEGIALFPCGNRGWWVTTDQGQERTFFHLFERSSLSYAGSFIGRRVANTDGIAVATVFGAASDGGALYAVDDDQAVAAFAWSDIVGALVLRPVCGRESGRAQPASQ